MRLRFFAWKEWLLLAVAVAVCGTAVAGVTSTPGLDGAPPAPSSSPAAAVRPAPARPAVRARSVLAVTKRRTTVRVLPARGAEPSSVIRRGIPLPVTAESNGFLRVITPCEVDGWVAKNDLVLHARGTRRPGSLRDATIVVDPGHGGLEPGAVGKGGLPEKTVNLDIASRLQILLRPARVFMTRQDDYTAALGYRTAIATAVGANLFVSVHNNASPDGPSEHPGTETYYQLKSPDSRRIAGLAYEEVRRALERFHVSWVSQDDAGAKYRMNERGIDYYFVLRHSTIPAVLVEAAYISNPPEEALLRREDVKDLMARALARAINRYITTDDPGSGFITKPLPRVSGPRSQTPPRCVDPR